jgi:AraC-like DNA-binding protein
MESFCIWFRDGFAEQALASSRTPVDRLLEEPGVRARHASRAVSFFERITPHDALVSPVLRRIYDAAITDCVTPDWLEEQFHHLIARLLEAQRGVYPEVDSIPGARAATRAELFRRVSRAKDYLDSSLYSNVTLDDLASSAAMSTHHFLRVFKHTYRETPGRYRSRRRMERAADLVAHTETPITDICMDLGFESLGTFSGKFRKVHGASPTEFRARSRTTPTPPII